jgi:NTP pyrophosphatase (non-canonical NTP hydrolase)
MQGGKGKGKELTIKEAQKTIDDWITAYGIRYFNELTNFALLTEEVGELGRIIARKYGEQSFKSGENSNLADEMADIMFVLMCLANQTGVDLEAALAQNLRKKTTRDSERHKNNPKLKL